MEVEKKFELKKWNAVALWSWNIQVEQCAICKSHLMEPCIECQGNLKDTSAEECVIAWGVCNHAYHAHCISRWLKQRNTCPMDNREWEVQRYGR